MPEVLVHTLLRYDDPILAAQLMNRLDHDAEVMTQKGLDHAISLPFFPLPFRLHPRGIVLGDIHGLEFVPSGNRVLTRAALLSREKLGDEVDVSTVRHLLESFHFVQGDVLLHEVAIRRTVAIRDLLFSPTI